MARPNLRLRRKPSKAPFPFLALPAELHLQIYNYLLLSVPSYSCRYTSVPHPRLLPCHQLFFCRHGMLLANRQLHAEYAQAFYEHTSFFFFVDTNNGRRPATVPFWTLSPALLPNLRQCKLCVDLGMLVSGLDPLGEALAAQAEALVGCMERVRWVHLVWELSIWTGPPQCDEELWERLGERFVQRLKGGAEMRGMTVTVGKRMLKLERKGAEWVGNFYSTKSPDVAREPYR
ncbi:hypothetical protein V2W45_1510643 [Cenococcum geophilum]